MKKFLLTTLGVTFSIGVSAQTVATDNFNALTAGNLATDLTGNLAGQGGFLIYGGAVSDYQIATIDAAHGNSLKITSGASYNAADNTPNVRFAFKSITTPATAGNNILKGTLEIYTGPATGTGKIQCALYDAAGDGVVGINYDFATKKIDGMGRLTQLGSTAKFYSIGLGTASYAANTWVSVAFTYNKTTGAYSWTYPEGTFTFDSTTNPLYSVSTGLVAAEYDIVSSTDVGNTVANTAAVDNINIVYSNAATLGTNEVTKPATVPVSVYPNPVSDVLTIKSDAKVNKVEIYDMSGRKVNADLNNDKVNVGNLNPGSYIITIETKEGKTTEKFIKK
ncbi:MAG: T9SS type A sorting domain-containing protein [Chryseobacterium sp.]|uniref:T9SS type A sorting domain-containing protein n=1 Tax=Chryseobacterium sp. TaxID=1871047 RepID=UPI0025C1ED9B|nr:T9SS type A sorting domain-containing protein [Chryseobacterium sp.]MCJ7932096.1 T9SS type A sorting domain-containing protein [Chryseobacterium sp.]